MFVTPPKKCVYVKRRACFPFSPDKSHCAEKGGRAFFQPLFGRAARAKKSMTQRWLQPQQAASY